MKHPGVPSQKPPANPAALPAESERTALDWAHDAGEADRLIADLDVFLRRRRRQRVTLASAGLALILLAVILRPAWRSHVATSPATESIAANAVIIRPETRTLPDGSVVELNAGAEIDVDFSGTSRRVALRKGEAHFRVEKDETRPFVVAVSGIEVRAVGTAFSVELGAKAIEVLVTEGRIAVDRPAQDSTAQPGAVPVADASGATFGAGKRIVVEVPPPGTGAPVPQVTTVSATEIDEHLAWRVPRLEFAGTPLAQALPMFNQHGGVRLSLADPALGRLQLSGVLRADDTESLLRLLEGAFGIRGESRAGEIVLRRRP